MRGGPATLRTRRHRLGQHFLRDGRVAHAIVAALPDDPPRVLEIGPGQGALTRYLIERFATVRAVEVDPALATRARSALAPAGVDVVQADALDMDLDAVTGGVPWLVAANLPYSVGTPILRRLMRRPDLFPVLVVMLQLEVAERLVAAPGDRRRGLLTLETDLTARARLLFTVPAGAFSPPPKVRSAVVHLAARDERPDAAVARGALALASAAFTQRRKKLANALASVSPPVRSAAAMSAVGLGAGARAEDLTTGEWLALAAELGSVGEAP